MELISIEELRSRMYHEAFEVDSDLQKYDSGCWIRYKLFENVLKGIPKIESRPKGKWKQISPAKIYECSVCGGCVMTDDIESYNYCHHCGIDMKGEGGDGEEGEVKNEQNGRNNSRC